MFLLSYFINLQLNYTKETFWFLEVGPTFYTYGTELYHPQDLSSSGADFCNKVFILFLNKMTCL